MRRLISGDLLDRWDADVKLSRATVVCLWVKNTPNLQGCCGLWLQNDVLCCVNLNS